MSRNTFSHFAMAPQADIKRSTFKSPSGVRLSFNVSELVPFFCREVLPGDSWKVKTSKVLRLQTLVSPVMDNLNFDFYYFFVPNRLLWTHWKELMGENSDSAWIPSVEYSVPQIEAPSGGWNIGTIADYFGLPTGVSGIEVSALPFRAYALICDTWFRDENNSQPLNIPVTDSDVTGVNTGNYVTDTAKGGLPFLACKYHDYYTSALRSPQKHASAVIPMEQVAPIYADPHRTIYDDGDDVSHWVQLGYYDSNGKYRDYSAYADIGVSPSGAMKNYGGTAGTALNQWPIFNNLFADLGAAEPTSINELRMAFQIQKLWERDARGGSRYYEQLQSHFGVSDPSNAILQRPEYLGGNRFPFNVQQVTQTSSTDNVTPQGNLAGFSVTNDVHYDFSKSFTEHGWIIGVCCARYEHSYQQGINRMWSRKSRFDFYWPELAHIGEQAILNKEIYATGVTQSDEQVFGYQEAWSEYRTFPNLVCGQMRSAANGGLDSWHFADYYSSLPHLSDAWIREDKTNVDRALAVQSSTANQIFGDIYFDVTVTRPMPLYSVPGLIDHF